jgi:hypothetical protein
MRSFLAALALTFFAANISLASDTATESKPAVETKSTDTTPAVVTTSETKTDDAEKPTVEFDDQTLTLAFEGKNPGEVIKEYIPTGETLEKWTKLASTREYSDLDNPLILATVLKKQLEEKYPHANCTLTEDADDNSAVIDFVLWSDDKSFVEFNVFKYSKTEDGGVLAEQYALRDYTNPQKFVDDLKETRDRTVKAMTEDGLQIDE